MQVPMRLASVRSGVSQAAQGLASTSLSTPFPVRSFVTMLPRIPKAQAARGLGSFVTQENGLTKPQFATGGMPPAAKKSAEAPAVDQQPVAPAKKVDASDKWKEITVDMWRDAVYTNQTYFGDLISDTTEFVKTIAEHIKLSGRRCSLVEVGCGTGEFVREAADDFRTAVGVDFNKEFVDFCKEHTIPRNAAKSHYLQGDACQLYELLKEEFPKTPQRGADGFLRRGVEFWDDTRIVACVGNTIGIIPEELRPKVYEQMAGVAGKDGVVVMVYWNAKWFGDAVLNFYHANPKLCGAFEGENVDFKNTTLKTPMDYKTKWTSVDEARQIMEDLGMEVISLREKGKGVFVAARRM